MSQNTNTDTTTSPGPNEPSAANGPSGPGNAPDVIDQMIAQFERVIRAAEAEHARAEELASIPDNVPRFVTEYRS